MIARFRNLARSLAASSSTQPSPESGPEAVEPQGQRFDRLMKGLEDLIEAEVKGVVEQRDAHLASLGRIRAAAESDVDLEKLQALRSFLLTETASAVPLSVYGHIPDSQPESGSGEEGERADRFDLPEPLTKKGD